MASARRVAKQMEDVLFEGGETSSQPTIDYKLHLDRFIQETDQLLALLEALMPQASWLDDEETLTYLHDCISDRPPPHRCTHDVISHRHAADRCARPWRSRAQARRQAPQDHFHTQLRH